MQLKRFLMEEDGVGVIEVKSIFLYTKSNSFKNAIFFILYIKTVTYAKYAEKISNTLIFFLVKSFI